MKNFFMSVPHSGEQVPEETPWLHSLPEEILMCDVDRYVDRLYQPVAQAIGFPFLVAKWHRYVADLNRLPEDVDELSVLGAKSPGHFSLGMGIHWAETTRGDTLMPQPMSLELHNKIVDKYYNVFHQQIADKYSELFKHGAKKVYHIDAHSMPSQGTEKHRDPGQQRPQIVVSDVDGQSCEPEFKDLVISAYTKAGLEVAYNWPYKGGRVTQIYGQPQKGQHAIQVEIRRNLYMDEESKKYSEAKALELQRKLQKAIEIIWDSL